MYKMTTDRCLTVIAGILEDCTFNHICFVAESLSTILPNFHYRSISKSSARWDCWLKETCDLHGWTHTKSPLIWREIGLSRSHVTYIGGSSQFWELLHNYYDISLYLSKEELDALQTDLLFACNIKRQRSKPLQVQKKYRQIMIIGAGRSMCPDLVPQLLMTKELWMTHGIVINLYDEPGCFFKLRKIFRDAGTIGAGINTVHIVENIPDGLKDCDILIYLDSLTREEYEGTDNWLQRNYKVIANLCTHINEHAPSHMKVIFCSMNLPCFYANIMMELVTKLSSTNIVVASAHYGLELIYTFVNSFGLNLQNFGCPPVWGFLGINHFVDVHHMIQKYDVYYPNKRALNSNENMILPLGTQHSELRWFFYKIHDKNPYKNYLKRKALLRYQMGTSEDFPKCRAICDLLKLWYSNKKSIGDEIISLGIESDGSFGIPKGLVFSQPVYLKEYEDGSRAWVPFRDFPMPNMPISIFQSLIDTGIYVKKKIIELKNSSDATK
ncbi:putative malate dehydrogenase 1B [Bombus affinis]|uniref:putative malate dehydrogenase 1B n=1 Tax=Bombus affinis TaxID=309941 RepID=UPI0021B780F6|nr:putative malate dehydrogenase 1B [Bombus affinis]